MAASKAAVKHLRKLYIGVAADAATATSDVNGCWLLATDSSAWYVLKATKWTGRLPAGRAAQYKE